MHVSKTADGGHKKQRDGGKGPRVTILTHPRVASPESADEIDPDAVHGATLDAALTAVYDTDAHFTAYEPVAIRCEGAPDGLAYVRLTYDALDHSIATRMVALVGDLDDPIAHASKTPARDAWRAEVEPRLDATRLTWYRTRGGARIIAPLSEPFEIASRRDAEAWTEFYGGWVQHMETTHGLELDPSCKDWTRLYRLPNVLRDGKRAAAKLHGTGRPWREEEWTAPPEGARAKAKTSAKAKTAALDKALILADRLPPSIEGAQGDEALYKAASEIATIVGDDPEAILTALDFFNERCQPPWPVPKLQREAERAAERVAGGVSQWLRDTAAKEGPATPPTGPLRAVAAGNGDDSAAARPNLLTIRSGSGSVYFVKDWQGRYHECGKHSLKVVLRESQSELAEELSKSTGRIIEECARSVGRIEWDYGRDGTVVYDQDGDRMLAGMDCPAIAPAQDDAVQAWLDAVAGTPERGAALREWIASTRQDAIYRPTTALLIVGPHSIGKSLIATVCAKLWGADDAVPLAHVAKQFNASMTSCPIVADDECKALAAKVISTEDFRSLIQARVRNFEPKGKEMRKLHGCRRFVISTNDLAAFRFSNSMGVGAVDAIAERLLQVVVPESGGPRVRKALDALRDDHGDIDFPRMLSHFEWIRTSTVLPDGHTRFLGSDPDKGSARNLLLASAVEEHEVLFDAIRDALSGETPKPGLMLASGALWVRPEEYAQRLCASDWTAARVRKAVAPFRGERAKFRDGAKTVRAMELDVARLADALGLDLGAICNMLEQAEQKKTPKPNNVIANRFRR